MSFIHTAAALGVMLCCAAATAQPLANIRQNCDLRVLQLNAVQKQQLQLLRREFKQQQQRKPQHNIQSETNTWRLNMLMANPEFDAETARTIILDSRRDELAADINELYFYHRLYHILTPTQQQTWLQSCVRR